ncbi:hypothetical protein [Paenibacillus aquistagni]|uniref:Uncharacterized protein n=1 Tax=Paenibacillus aquistagni TaxID=1852522 RepID=A0A1X7LS31_9BACL|nr:hypothetical protein [Paenibacillus aquistagni]SMG56470.1 hypothetical protein SAMN06295960_4137 [Paenibacillus aquistagni]
MVNKRSRRKETGNIVETFYSGDSVIHICDDCVLKTEEEIQAALRKYHLAGWAIILSTLKKKHEAGGCKNVLSTFLETAYPLFSRENSFYEISERSLN